MSENKLFQVPNLGNSIMERKVAFLSIIFALVHFVGETLWHLKFGQPISMLVVDYIAVSLLLYGGFKAIKNAQFIGLLCGAWGFEFCLNYRALFNRVEKMASGIGHGDPAIDSTAYVLAVLMAVSITMFVSTIYLCHRQVKNV